MTAYAVPTPLILPFAFAIANLPSPSGFRGQLVEVVDLYDGIGGYCESDGVAWVPRRAHATALRAISMGGTLTLRPLIDRPLQILTGAIGTGLTLQVGCDPAWAWNGCPFRVVNRLTGTGTLKLLGKILAPGWADVSFDGTAFQIVGTAGLL